MKSESTREDCVDCVGWVPESLWWVRTGSWMALFIEKASKAQGCNRRKMGDLVPKWQRFFCLVGGSQGHSQFCGGGRDDRNMIETGDDWTGMWRLLCSWLKSLKAKLAWGVTSCIMVCLSNSFNVSPAPIKFKWLVCEPFQLRMTRFRRPLKKESASLQCIATLLYEDVCKGKCNPSHLG